jgi:hypothetical protein
VKLEDYLGALTEVIKPLGLLRDNMVFDQLEGVHSRFMESGSS